MRQKSKAEGGTVDLKSQNFRSEILRSLSPILPPCSYRPVSISAINCTREVISSVPTSMGVDACATIESLA